MTSPEIVVVGGGPAGTVAALVLARAGRRVLLVDAGTRDPTRRVGEALPPASRPLLADLGLLDRIRCGPHLPCLGNVSAWGSPVARTHDFLREPHGPGWHLDRAAFDASLRAAAEEAGARVESRVRGRGLERHGEGWRVRLRQARAETREVDCTWIVDATGRSSALARRLGATRRRDDRLLAFVARYRPTPDAPADQDARTWIEAAPGGWWYTARVPSGDRVVAFHSDADLSDSSVLRTSDGFGARLTETRNLHALLVDRGYVPAHPPHGVDASSARLDRVAGPGWLAVGDAAVSFDPLSSQGLLNACYTGLRGAEAVLAGSPSALAAYSERVETIYRTYLDHKASFYALEERWPERPFWRRRRPGTSGHDGRRARTKGDGVRM